MLHRDFIRHSTARALMNAFPHLITPPLLFILCFDQSPNNSHLVLAKSHLIAMLLYAIVAKAKLIMPKTVVEGTCEEREVI